MPHASQTTRHETHRTQCAHPWWRRTRGYKAFAKRFHKLISAETEDFMHQLKVVQTQAVCDEARRVLVDFFEQQKDIMLELNSPAAGGGDVQNLFMDAGEIGRRETVQTLIGRLQKLAPASP